jgi:hypothetical protein
MGTNFIRAVPNIERSKSRVYTTVILGTARLNFGWRTHFFGHGTVDFCRVNATLKVRVPKILGGPRPPQVVSAPV